MNVGVTGHTALMRWSAAQGQGFPSGTLESAGKLHMTLADQQASKHLDTAGEYATCKQGLLCKAHLVLLWGWLWAERVAAPRLWAAGSAA